MEEMVGLKESLQRIITEIYRVTLRNEEFLAINPNKASQYRGKIEKLLVWSEYQLEFLANKFESPRYMVLGRSNGEKFKREWPKEVLLATFQKWAGLAFRNAKREARTNPNRKIGI